MGFTTIINPSGKEVLCCDFCDGYIGDGKTKFVRKKPCTFGWCQPYATCNNCWAQNNKMLHLKHGCHTYSKDFHDKELRKQKILEKGYYIRVAALSHDNKVKVIFRNKESHERAFFMDESTYDSINLSEIATIEDYAKIGIITECDNIDLHDAR